MMGSHLLPLEMLFRAIQFLSGLLPEREDEHRVPGSNGDVLPAIRQVGDWTAGNLTSKLSLPQQLAVTRVESVEVALAAAAEQDIRRCRQNSCVRDIVHGECPFPLARLWIEGLDRTGRSWSEPSVCRRGSESRHGIRPERYRWEHPRKLCAFCIRRRIAGILSVDRRRVGPCGNVEQPRAWAKGR